MKLKRIVDTSKTVRKIDPKEIGEILGAEYIGKAKVTNPAYKKIIISMLLAQTKEREEE